MEMVAEALGGEGRVSTDVLEWSLQAEVTHQFPNQSPRVSRGLIGPAKRLTALRRSLEVGVDELDVSIPPHRREDSPGDRVEEGLGHLQVFPSADHARIHGL